MDSDDAEVAGTLATARSGFESIRSRPDDPAKFKAMSQLAEGLRNLWEDAVAERPGIVRRYRDSNKLALLPLSRQLGVSKTRTHQLYAAAEEQDPDPCVTTRP